MAKHRTTLNDFPDILRHLPDRFTEATVRGLRSASHRLVGYTVEEILDADAIARGELAASVRSYNLPDGGYTIVEAPYARPVEDGSRPHTPPLQPLIDWVRVKGFATDDVEARRIALRVQAAIRRRGTKPRRYFSKAVARIKPEIIEHILDEWNKL